MDETLIYVIGIIATLIICSPLIILWAFKSHKARKMRNAYKKLKIGMSERELLDLLGSPDSVGKLDVATKIYNWRNDEWIMRGAFDNDGTRAIKVYVRLGAVVGFDGININKRTW